MSTAARMEHSSAIGGCARVLLIADPGAPADIAKSVARSLPDELDDRLQQPVEWDVSVRIEPFLPDEQAPIGDVISSVDPISENADVVVYLTDLPRRDHTLPIVVDLSVEHRFALVSIAGVGVIRIKRRIQDLIALAIGELLAESALTPSRLQRLPSKETDCGVRYFAPRGLRRAKLLAGMVRANRPWRLATGVSKVLVGAFASGAIAMVMTTIWSFSQTMDPWRLIAATLLSVSAIIAWLIIDHELWERAKAPAERQRTVLYNITTLITLVIGVGVLYLALFCMLLFTAILTLPPGMITQTIGHPVGLSDYLLLAWLLASIATVGGALGSGLEDDEAVKTAAYGVRQRQRFDSVDKASLSH
jgi:hypothetical protein